MVVGVWEFVLFLWSHPIISCMVLLLFSPPFFPVIVYFSPLLICTGLVAIAMVSMNMGGSAESEEDWRDGARRLHEPAVQHVEMQLNPAQESWLEWMRKMEERTKGWVESRLLNQEKSQLQFKDVTSFEMPQRGLSTPLPEVTSKSISVSGPEEDHASMAVDDKDIDEGRHIQASTELLNPPPIVTSCDTPLPELAKPAKASDDWVHLSVTGTEEIQPVPDVDFPTEDSSFEASSLDHPPPTRLVVTLAVIEEEEEVWKGEILVLSPLMEENLRGLPVRNNEAVSIEEILPPAPKDESRLDEPAISDEEGQSPSLDESVTEVASVLLREEVIPPVYIDEITCKAPEEEARLPITATDGVDEVWMNKSVEKSASSEESRAFVTDYNQCARIEPLLMVYGPPGDDAGSPLGTKAGQSVLVEDETSKIQTSAHPDGSSLEPVEAFRPVEQSASDEDRQASPEPELSVFTSSNLPDVISPTERFIETEKIIFVDEPSNIATAGGQRKEVEAGQIEASSPIQKSLRQMFAEETEKDSLDRGSEDGLDENIEACKSIFPTTTEPMPMALQDSEPMAVVSESCSEEDLPSKMEKVIQSDPDKNGLESSSFCDAQIEPVSSSMTNDGVLTTAPSVLDKSLSLKSTRKEGEEQIEPVSCSVTDDEVLTTAHNSLLDKSLSSKSTRKGGEEHDDLTERFLALKKSMSLDTSAGQEEQISLRRAEAVVFPVFSPSKITRVELDPFSESLVFPEKRKPRPVISSGALESVQAITARLQKKYTPNWGKGDDATTVPLKEETIRPANPVTTAIAAAAVERAMTGEITESSLMPPVDPTAAATPVDAAAAAKNELQATPDNLNSRKLLSSFLSRRRDRLMSPLMEAFSTSSEGDRGKKLGSGTETLPRSDSFAAEEREEGSTTTISGRLLKDKMMSPLKRVFSMDVNTGGSRKLDVGRSSSLPIVKEKQSVVDRSKDRFMKLFSSEGGGTTKLGTVEAEELAVLGKAGLQKSKSDSQSGSQSTDSGEEENVPVANELLLTATPPLTPSSEEHGVETLDRVETVDIESERRLSPSIATASRDESREEESDFKLEAFLPPSTDKRVTPTTIDLGGTDEFATTAGGRLLKSSSQEKKFSFSWTKKKRSSEPLDSVVARLKSPEEKVSLSGECNDEESREIFMSPLNRFTPSSPMMNSVGAGAAEDADAGAAPPDENHSPATAFFWPSPVHRESLKAESPDNTSSSSWWTPKAHSSEERVEPSKKKVSTSWWSRRHSRADSKASHSFSTPRDNNITTDSSSKDITTTRVATSPEKIVDVSSSSPRLTSRDNSDDNSVIDSHNMLDIADEEGAAAQRPWHRRERSDSLPVSSSKFSRLRERQSSMSEIILSRTPEESPASSFAFGRVTNYLDESPSASMGRRDDGVEHDHHHDLNKRNIHLMDNNQNSTNNNTVRSYSTPTSYQNSPSVRTLDRAHELRNSFNGCDLDVNNRMYRNSPSVAEIRITDKLKMPLDEVLSLLSTGERDHPTTAETMGGTVADSHPQPPSSSEDETSLNSSEEEWSTSEDEEDEPQQPLQQYVPPPGRIRRRLPHYIFNRGVTTAN